MAKITINDNLQREIEKECRLAGQDQDEIIQDTLKRRLSLMRFERLRKDLIPYAKAAGYTSEEEILRDIS